MNDNEITINGEEWIKKSSLPPSSEKNAVNTEGLPYVICRGYYCGVHAGFLKWHDGNHVRLVNSRRMWAWKAQQGITLSAVAKYGITKDTDLPNVLDEIWLGDVWEIIPCTETAAKSIQEAADYEQRTY